MYFPAQGENVCFLKSSLRESQQTCNLSIRNRRAHTGDICPKNAQNACLMGKSSKKKTNCLKKDHRRSAFLALKASPPPIFDQIIP